jgi:hypothetical protein
MGFPFNNNNNKGGDAGTACNFPEGIFHANGLGWWSAGSPAVKSLLSATWGVLLLSSSMVRKGLVGTNCMQVLQRIARN